MNYKKKVTESYMREQEPFLAKARTTSHTLHNQYRLLFPTNLVPSHFDENG